MPDAVIVDAVRSPIGRAFKGSLTSIRPDDLGAYVVDQLLERNPDVAPDSIEDLICGCGLPQGEQSFNIGRIIALLSRLPDSVTGTTVHRYCASSLQAIRIAAHAAPSCAASGPSFLPPHAAQTITPPASCGATSLTFPHFLHWMRGMAGTSPLVLVRWCHVNCCRASEVGVLSAKSAVRVNGILVDPSHYRAYIR